MTYLDEFVSHLYPRGWVPGPVRPLLEAQPSSSDSDSPGRDRPLLNSSLVAKTVSYIHSNRPRGAILVFLPGWQEIKSVMDELEEQRLGNVLVVPVHSKLSSREQDRIFSKPPSGVRKVVLATNIAETSITIDDVRYVVDAGYHRQNVLVTFFVY